MRLWIDMKFEHRLPVTKDTLWVVQYNQIIIHFDFLAKLNKSGIYRGKFMKFYRTLTATSPK